MALRICCCLLVLRVAAAWAAQASSVLVAVDEGARLRPVARFDGTRWAATCQAPANRGATAAGARLPRVIVDGGSAAEAVRAVTRGGSEWRQLEPVVRRLFETRARQESVSASALASVALSIDALFTSAAGSSPQIYYFRASKTIPDSRGDVDADDDGEVDPRGDLRLDVTGWLQRESEVSSLGTNAALSWEQVDDRPRAGTRRSELTPIGIVHMASARIWIMQGRAGDGIWYTLYDVGAASKQGDASRRVELLVRTDLRGC
jgi:hypothetical protein